MGELRKKRRLRVVESDEEQYDADNRQDHDDYAAEEALVG